MIAFSKTTNVDASTGTTREDILLASTHGHGLRPPIRSGAWTGMKPE
jgi:hypothetical protein